MKLLVSDFDGTLHTDDEHIEKNVQRIKSWRKSGNLFMLSSGRSYQSLLEKIDTYQIPVDFFSTADGSYLFDQERNLLFEGVMKQDILKELGSILSLPIYQQIQYGIKETYLLERPTEEPISSVNFVLHRKRITDFFLEEWDKLDQHTDYDFLVYDYQDIFFYCIKPRGIDKAAPISYLAHTLHIPKRDIYTVGDGTNDKPMLEKFNGYQIGDNEKLLEAAVDHYDQVYDLIRDIKNQKVKKRYP